MGIIGLFWLHSAHVAQPSLSHLKKPRTSRQYWIMTTITTVKAASAELLYMEAMPCVLSLPP